MHLGTARSHHAKLARNAHAAATAVASCEEAKRCGNREAAAHPTERQALVDRNAPLAPKALSPRRARSTPKASQISAQELEITSSPRIVVPIKGIRLQVDITSGRKDTAAWTVQRTSNPRETDTLNLGGIGFSEACGQLEQKTVVTTCCSCS
jgi:hypothetical protein